MSILFSHWKEEETFEEKYNNILGCDEQGRSISTLKKDVEKSLSNNYTSKTERKQLLNLQQEIYNSEQN